jgi:lysozyme family protein
VRLQLEAIDAAPELFASSGGASLLAGVGDTREELLSRRCAVVRLFARHGRRFEADGKRRRADLEAASRAQGEGAEDDPEQMPPNLDVAKAAEADAREALAEAEARASAVAALARRAVKVLRLPRTVLEDSSSERRSE